MTKNWHLQTVVLEKTPERHLDSKEIKLVNLKGDQPWIFTGRTDDEAETPVFWSSVVHRQFIEEVPGAGKDPGQKEKRASEDETARRHHQCNELNLVKLWEMVRDRVTWSAAVCGVTKSWTYPGDLTTTIASVQFSCSVVSDSLWSPGLQHARPPCPSPTPGACSNSFPSSQWCHPTISSSVVPFSHLQSFPASGSFQWVSYSHKVAKLLEFQLHHQSFQ